MLLVRDMHVLPFRGPKHVLAGYLLVALRAWVIESDGSRMGDSATCLVSRHAELSDCAGEMQR